MRNPFIYTESTRELKLEINNRVVILGGDGKLFDNNTVSISQTRNEKIPHYPSLYKYGFRVKSFK